MAVIQSETFVKWLKSLKDIKARDIVLKRVLRIQAGLLGDIKPIGEGLSELRIHYAQRLSSLCKTTGKHVNYPSLWWR